MLDPEKRELPPHPQLGLREQEFYLNFLKAKPNRPSSARVAVAAGDRPAVRSGGHRRQASGSRRKKKVVEDVVETDEFGDPVVEQPDEEVELGGDEGLTPGMNEGVAGGG